MIHNGVGQAHSGAVGAFDDTLSRPIDSSFNGGLNDMVLIRDTARRRDDPRAGFNGGLNDMVLIQIRANPPTLMLPTNLTNSAANGNSGEAGEPFSTATGEFFDSAADLVLGGPIPVGFARYYASLLSINGVASSLGNNWTHNYDWQLTLDGGRATVRMFRGKQVAFNQLNGNWQLANPEPVNYQLASVDGGFEFMNPSTDLVYTFADTGALTAIRDRNGNTLTVTQGPSGPTQVSDGLGRVLSFTYTGGKLTRVEDQTGRGVSFAYDADNLTAVTDANGNTTSYSYTTAGERVGLLVAETLPAGNAPLTQTYDADARVTQQSDSRRNVMRVAYDTPAPATTTVTDALGSSFQHSHEGLNELGTLGDAAGQTASVEYDAGNRRTALIDRLGGRTSATYDRAGNKTSVTNAAGETTTLIHEAQTQGPFTFYDLAGLDFPDGMTERMTYDDAGNLLTFTDRARKLWRLTYNSRGQVLTVRNPAGGVTTHTYNGDGTRASTTLPSGETTAFEYDAQKRLVEINHPDGTSEQLSYNSRNQLVSYTEESGEALGFDYNTNNRLASMTDFSNQTATFSYDTDEHVATITDRAGKIFQRSYTERGQLQTMANPAGESLTLGYNELGRITSAADAGGQLASFGYDAEGRLTSATDGLSRTGTFTRDAAGRITRTTDPLGQSSRFAYDSMGRIDSFTNPLSQATRLSYNARGLLSGASLPEGMSASYAYNDLGRLSGVTDPNGNNWTWSYDNSGRLVSGSDPLGRTTTFTYDSRQRLSQLDLPASTLTFTYDEAGNLLRRLYSDSTDIQYTYDDNNRLVAANGISLAYDANGRVIGSNGLAITRDDVGRIAAITYAPGKTVNYEYNSRGLLARVTDWVGGATEFSYDAALQLVSMRRPNGVTGEFTYDGAGRVAGISQSGTSVDTSIMLTRDAVGRITSADRNLPLGPTFASSAQDLSYDAAHQVSSFEYDGMGRLISDGVTTYTWDLASRLTGFSGGGSSASFQYDGLGLLISGRRNYVWNHALALPSMAVEREGEADVRYYVHQPNGVLLHAIDAAGNQRHFYHFDRIGNTVMLTDDSGAVSDSYAVTPYGEVVSRSGSTENPFTFQGALGVMEVESSGLYYMRARFYDSASARFLSRDPILSLEPPTINPYQYARTNPLLFVDPTGLTGAVLDAFVDDETGDSEQLTVLGQPVGEFGIFAAILGGLPLRPVRISASGDIQFGAPVEPRTTEETEVTFAGLGDLTGVAGIPIRFHSAQRVPSFPDNTYPGVQMQPGRRQESVSQDTTETTLSVATDLDVQFQLPPPSIIRRDLENVILEALQGGAGKPTGPTDADSLNILLSLAKYSDTFWCCRTYSYVWEHRKESAAISKHWRNAVSKRCVCSMKDSISPKPPGV